MKKKGWMFVSALCLLLAALAACSSEGKEKKVRDLDFTVIGPEELPADLAEMMEQKKESGFRLSCSEDGVLYLAVGYGKQKTAGCSVTVPEFYETEHTLVVRTELLGPKQGEKAEPFSSCPWTALRTEWIDKPIVFE